MSRAFVKEMDDAPDLPDRLISEHANLVTPEGLAAIEAAVARFEADHVTAQAAADRNAMTAAARDLRYWQARRVTAELVPPPVDDGEVRFGARVTLLRPDGRRITWRIVGEDEADPRAGSLSYVAPLARALIGRRVGDEVATPAGLAEIVAIA